MTGLALRKPSQARPFVGPDARIWAMMVLLATAFLIRAPAFGNPAYEIDEQFYLLVGDRMLHGQLPYVDIWDRKPIGLFLIFAFARLLGGEGFVAYQVLATLFAAATAWCIFAIARRPAGSIGATVSGGLYLLWIEIAEGGGGQSPVFYNLAIATAALLLVDGGDRPRLRAYGAMVLCGIAIQIKYSAVVEACFLGLVAIRRVSRGNDRAALAEAPALALTALLPTLAAIAAFAMIGELPAFWFANFTSIFLRGPTPAAELDHRAAMAMLRVLPLAACASAAGWQLLYTSKSAEDRRWLLFMTGWCAAALLGFFAIGVLYAHYLLPVFVPFAAAAAPIFRRWPSGPVLAGIAAWLPASHLDWPDITTTARSRQEIAALAALVPTDVSTGCMQMFDGPPILYYVTHACTVSRFVFPDHLSAAIEEVAIGVEPAAEVRRVLARRPLAITIGDSDVRPPNPTTFAIMRRGLTAGYKWAGRARIGERYVSVYVRR